MAETTEKAIEESGEAWTEIIRPRSTLFDLKLKEVWRYRDLVLLFVRRDFVAVYKQTILGPVWHLLKPMFSTLIFTVIFANVAGLSTDGVPPILFYLCGNIAWGFFQACFTGAAGTFVVNQGIFGKVYFPRLAVPVSNMISALLSFVIQFGLLLSFMVYYYSIGRGVTPTVWMLGLPVLMLLMAMFGLSLGIIVAALTTKYRDLTVLVGFGITLFMYASPVIYPMSMMPAPYDRFMSLNPMAPLLEAFRYAILGKGILDLPWIGFTAAGIVVVFLVGVVMFNKVEKDFIDTV